MAMNQDEVSRHFTRRGALGKKYDLNVEQAKKRSSGWARIDYGVRKVNGFSLKPWRVVVRYW